MSSRHSSNSEEYVLVPASKVRSGARRSIALTVTAICALVAIGVGTGTFASFTASTTNASNVFSTGRLQLSNKVGTGSACFSGYSGTGTLTTQANLDNN